MLQIRMCEIPLIYGLPKKNTCKLKKIKDKMRSFLESGLKATMGETNRNVFIEIVTFRHLNNSSNIWD